MFNNIALDIVIGLVFIYLLYSLLATVLAEIIAVKIGLRARNLREAVDRMLNDKDIENWFLRLWDSLSLMKNPKNERINKFYSNPEIKYLGSTGIFRNPSSFKAETFSRTLLYELNGSGPLDRNRIEQELLRSINPQQIDPAPKDGVTHPVTPVLDRQSAQFVLSLFHDSYGDLVKFKLHLEAWFDRTMEQATEWYKRKIQVVLLVLGFLMAWFFFADTFIIISKLSKDKDARDKMVTLASDYIQNNRSDIPEIDSTSALKQKLDTLLDIKKQLDADVRNAHTLLGLGGWLPKKILIKQDPATKKIIYVPEVDAVALKHTIGNIRPDQKNISIGFGDRLLYLLWLFWRHFPGFLITAIAISLGAPFWFDLLNKLMKLRTSIKQPINSTENDARRSGGFSPLNREG